MTTIYIDSRDRDADRRARLYQGALLVFSPRASIRALADFAREMLAEAFAPYDPRDAQFHMAVEDWVARFAPVKPAFIHHPRTRELMVDILDELEKSLNGQRPA